MRDIVEADSIFREKFGQGAGGVCPFEHFIFFEKIDNKETVAYSETKVNGVQYILIAREVKVKSC